MYTEVLAAIQPILDAFTLIATIVSAISVLVATITIFVMIYVNAMSKRRQIGILRAIGIKKNIIIYSYMFQALYYVACGITAGLAIVFGIVEPLTARYPIQLPFGPMVLTFGVPLVMEGVGIFFVAGLFSGIVPSRLVTKEEILKAIWG
jgi:putative ABC transport system permease protein